VGVRHAVARNDRVLPDGDEQRRALQAARCRRTRHHPDHDDARIGSGLADRHAPFRLAESSNPAPCRDGGRRGRRIPRLLEQAIEPDDRRQQVGPRELGVRNEATPRSPARRAGRSTRDRFLPIGWRRSRRRTTEGSVRECLGDHSPKPGRGGTVRSSRDPSSDRRSTGGAGPRGSDRGRSPPAGRRSCRPHRGSSKAARADTPRSREGAAIRSGDHWAIRLFCSAFTRLSVQKVQPEP
jgi:hypothetical protein